MIALKTEPTTFADAWADYFVNILLPRKPGQTQVKETQRAFYAGGWAMFCLVQNVAPNSVSEDAGIQMLSALMDECMEFGERIKQGKA